MGLSTPAALLAIMGLSAALKLVMLAIGEDLNTDAILYLAAAQKIGAGHFREALALFPMPALSMLIAGLHTIVGDWVWAGRLVSTVALVAASIPLYLITVRLLDRRAALWAALLLAVSPVANGYAVDIMRDPVYVLLFLVSVLCLIQGFHSLRWQWVGLGLMAAVLAILMRVEAIVLLVAPPFFLAGLAVCKRREPLGRLAWQGLGIWLGLPALLLALGLVLVGPELLSANRFDQLLGEARSIVDGTAFHKYQEIYRHLKDLQADPPFSGYSRSLMAFVRHYMPFIYLAGLGVLLGKILFPPFLIPLAAGVRHAWRQQRPGMVDRAFLLFLLAAYLLFLFYFLLTTDRMVARLLFMPTLLLFPWIGAGMDRLAALAGSSSRRLRLGLTAAVVVGFLVYPATKSLSNILETDNDFQQVGAILAQMPSAAGERFVFSDVRLSFYAGRLEDYRRARRDAITLNRHIQEGRFPDVDRYARRRRADWLVLHLELPASADPPALRSFNLVQKWPAQGGYVVLYRRRAV